MPKTFYITTAIAYVNSKPHMGHAMECIEEDALARFHRMIGDDTRMLMGTDEHGMKIVQTAKKANIEVRALVDRNAALFQGLKEKLNLSYDQFIRTSDQQKHWPGVIEMWKRLVKSGDIYKDKYEGYYCVGCEAFVTETDLVDGKCPIHLTVPEKIQEENYFFTLSKYKDTLMHVIESGEFRIVPQFRANEILNIIKDLKDVSFSRPSSVLNWGIPVPGDPDQVMYVWCDALTNYISALGFGTDMDQKYLKYWQNGDTRVQIVGKDILRFHAAIWPAMLMSAGAPLATSLIVHGFVNMGGEKMSKSRGNVVDPLDVVTEWGIDALRWYLLREIPMGMDGDYTAERFAGVYESELANTIGNLVQRVCHMVKTYGVPLGVVDAEITAMINEHWKRYQAFLEKEFAIHEACLETVKLATNANQYVEENKPWQLAKTDSNKLAQALSNLTVMIRALSVMLYPLVPGTSDKIRARLGLPSIGTSGFDLQMELSAGTSGVTAQEDEQLFPRHPS